MRCSLTRDRHSRKLASSPPHHTVGDEAQAENTHTYSQQCFLYYVQHLDTRNKLPLKHVCCFIIKRSRLVEQQGQRKRD